MTAISAETELICRWVVIKPAWVMKIEKDESKNKIVEKMSDEKNDQIEIDSMNENLYETDLKNWSCLFQIWRKEVIQ